VTVLEAQEVGEAFDLQDRLLYALDGLRAGSGGGGAGAAPPTSAAAAAAAAEVADVLASRRGRLALRAGGLFGEVMAAGAAAVAAAVRASLAAAAAASGAAATAAAAAAAAAVALPLAACYLSLAADPSCRAALAVPDAARLATALLACHADAETGAAVSDGAAPAPDAPPLPAASPAGRALRLLRGGVLARAVPGHASACPSSVVMAAIAHTTDPAAVESAAAAAAPGGAGAGAVAADAVKAALGDAGAVAALAAAAAVRAAQAAALPAGALEEYEAPPQPGGGGAAGAAAAPLSPPSAAAHARAVRAARVLWPLHAALTCVEQLTFAAADNEARALAATVPAGGWCTGGYAPGRPLPFPAWLVCAVSTLGGHPGTPGAPARPSRAAAACERVALAVLMNVTQAGGPGCGPVVAAGGVAAAGRALVAALPPGEGASPAADRAAALASSRRLSVALGLLINLADGGGGDACAALAALDGGAAVRALGRLMGAAAAAAAGRADGPPPQPAPTPPPARGSATEASLDADDEEGEASILEAYAAVALAFLLEGAPPGARPALVAAVPPAVGLGGVAAAVAQCLRFYARAGAITPRAAASLQRVLRALVSDIPGVVSAGVR